MGREGKEGGVLMGGGVGGYRGEGGKGVLEGRGVGGYGGNRKGFGREGVREGRRGFEVKGEGAYEGMRKGYEERRESQPKDREKKE